MGIDDALLSDSSFKLSNLESKKSELEERVSKFSSQFSIVISNEKTLA
jgi:hypothetical protein